MLAQGGPESLSHEHPNQNANMLGMITNIPGMFVSVLGCSCKAGSSGFEKPTSTLPLLTLVR